MRRALTLVAVCVAVAASPAAAQPAATAGVVKILTGTASVVRAGKELPIAIGEPLAEGDAVRTGSGARLGITLKDGTRLSLGANTELRIDSFAYAPGEGRLGMTLKLLRGVTEYISGRIAKLAPGAVRVETPTSIIGIRGTRLLIGAGQP